MKRGDGLLVTGPPPLTPSKTKARAGLAAIVALGGRHGKVEPREIVAKWIEERRQERDATALTWLLQRTAFALLTCYPKGQGHEALWATFRMLAGAEMQAQEKQGPAREEG